VEDSVETVKSWATFNGEPPSRWPCCASPAPTPCGGRRGARSALPGLQRAAAQVGQLTPVNDRSLSVREALHDVTLTLMGTIALVVLVIFLFLRRFVATVIPALSLAGVADRRGGAAVGPESYSLDNISLLG
jgi:HAE1 family hydrophobic/amphiphilic exporter-1